MRWDELEEGDVIRVTGPRSAIDGRRETRALVLGWGTGFRSTPMNTGSPDPRGYPVAVWLDHLGPWMMLYPDRHDIEWGAFDPWGFVVDTSVFFEPLGKWGDREW